MSDHYQYALAMERRDRTSLGQFPATMDWTPAHELARFMTLRERNLGALPVRNDVTIEPQWDGTLGEPHVGGVRVIMNDNGNPSTAVTLPLSYFGSAARKVSRELVANKSLKPNEEFNYSVVAFRSPNTDVRENKPTFSIEEAESPPIVTAISARTLFDQATAFGTHHDDDVPLFIPQSLLDHASELTCSAAADETAGILIGHVGRDPVNQRVFIRATDLIPAKHTLSKTTAVTFTPETWTAAESAIQLRRNQEIMIGWFHSHPAKFWCSPNCGPEARQACPLGRSFFSGEDCSLHRTVFPVAYGVALVVTHVEGGMRYAVFGWRQGQVVQRGFHVLNASQEVADAISGEAIIGENHEKNCN